MRYIVEIKKKIQYRFKLEYEDGLLSSVSFPAGSTAEQLLWLMRTIPVSESELINWQAEYRFINASPVPVDLSFNAFWNAYDYKIGRRDRAYKLWSALAEEEKAKAIMAIPKYKYWLAMRPNIERLYPETFLSQKRFENEYK